MISREQIVQRLRAAGWQYSTQTKRVQIYRRPGHPQRVAVRCRDVFPESAARIILAQGGLSPHEIEAFLVGCVKS